jgi:hypothetical protein
MFTPRYEQIYPQIASIPNVLITTKATYCVKPRIIE